MSRQRFKDLSKDRLCKCGNKTFDVCFRFRFGNDNFRQCVDEMERSAISLLE